MQTVLSSTRERKRKPFFNRLTACEGWARPGRGAARRPSRGCRSAAGGSGTRGCRAGSTRLGRRGPTESFRSGTALAPAGGGEPRQERSGVVSGAQQALRTSTAWAPILQVAPPFSRGSSTACVEAFVETNHLGCPPGKGAGLLTPLPASGGTDPLPTCLPLHMLPTPFPTLIRSPPWMAPTRPAAAR